MVALFFYERLAKETFGRTNIFFEWIHSLSESQRIERVPDKNEIVVIWLVEGNDDRKLLSPRERRQQTWNISLRKYLVYFN